MTRRVCPTVEELVMAVAADAPFPWTMPVSVPKIGAEVLNVCCPVHVFACPSAREATTAPTVGEIVSVPSEFDTEDTAPAGVVVAITFPFGSIARIAPAGVPKAVSHRLLVTVARDVVEFAKLKSAVAVDEALSMIPPVLKVWSPVQVGMMLCESAGAPSERMKVVAEPFWVDKVTFADGFAPVAVEQVVQVSASVPPSGTVAAPPSGEAVVTTIEEFASPAFVSAPDTVGVKRTEFAEGTMLIPYVTPFTVAVVVEKDIAVPVVEA